MSLFLDETRVFSALVPRPLEPVTDCLPNRHKGLKQPEKRTPTGGSRKQVADPWESAEQPRAVCLQSPRRGNAQPHPLVRSQTPKLEAKPKASAIPKVRNRRTYEKRFNLKRKPGQNWMRT